MNELRQSESKLTLPNGSFSAQNHIARLQAKLTVISPSFDFVREIFPLGPTGRDLHRVFLLPCRPCHRPVRCVDYRIVHLAKVLSAARGVFYHASRRDEKSRALNDGRQKNEPKAQIETTRRLGRLQQRQSQAIQETTEQMEVCSLGLSAHTAHYCGLLPMADLTIDRELDILGKQISLRWKLVEV